MPVVRFERGSDAHGVADVFIGVDRHGTDRRTLGSGAQLRRQVVDVDGLARGYGDGVTKRVFELADVAGPGLLLQQLHGVGGDMECTSLRG